MTICARIIEQFLSEHQLSQHYAEQIEGWFIPLAEEIILHHKSAEAPFIIGIHGAQGSGKSTLADLLITLFSQHYQLDAVSLSLDDFYLSHQHRLQLGKSVHPLLRTRGVPGTHNIKLAINTLKNLAAGNFPIKLPQFDKAHDDCVPASKWPVINSTPDLIVLEGWCLGALPESPEALKQSINALEQEEDSSGQWRQHVNQQLFETYPALFSQIDFWVMLKAPSFDCIYQWRLQQENKLADRQQQENTPDKIMDEAAVNRFIQFYQRLTEHCLTTLPDKMDVIFELNPAREIVAMQRPNQPHSTQETKALLIFTDLDGTLLDHHSYRHDEADDMLHYLKTLQIPVIPVSSKTQSEIELLRYNLDNTHPFICENGAAVYIPNNTFTKPPKDTRQFEGYWVKEFVQNRQHWQQLIDTLRPEFGEDFTTFADAGIDGIIAMTGLDVHAAARAARRQYGEAISWHGSTRKKQAFCRALTQRGANVLQGGRFLHVSGACDKGQALSWLTALYHQNYPSCHLMTLAIGDSQNDIAMLEEADLALLIPSPVQDLPKVAPRHGIFTAKHTGPRGWSQGVAEILSSLKITAADTVLQEHAHG